LVTAQHTLLTAVPEGQVVGQAKVLKEWEVLHMERVGGEQVHSHPTNRF
jgi:hypothetical protein